MSYTNNAEEWRKCIADYRSSGLTANAWCEKNKKSRHALYYWITKFNKAESNDEAKQQWVSIPVRDQVVNHPSITLKIDSISIEVSAGFDKNVLMDVLSVVQSYDRINRF